MQTMAEVRAYNIGQVLPDGLEFTTIEEILRKLAKEELDPSGKEVPFSHLSSAFAYGFNKARKPKRGNHDHD